MIDLRGLAESWEIAMDAAGISRNTARAYRIGVAQLLDWGDRAGTAIDLGEPEHVRMWLAALREAGMSPMTRRSRLAAVRSFARWLVEERELPESGAHRVEWPKVDETVPDALTREQLAAILRTCDPATFTGIRDQALLSLLMDSLLRADELLSMRIRGPGDAGDVNLRERTVRVRRGKGGKERYSGFSRETARLLDRYQRHRGRQRNADLPAYWLSVGRGAMSYGALYSTVSRRGAQAGLDVYPHMARAGGAVEWRERGGSVPGLMAVAGWRSMTMVGHYTRAAEQRLALAEQQRLHDQD